MAVLRVAAPVFEAVFFAAVFFGADLAAAVFFALCDAVAVFLAGAFFATVFFAADFFVAVFFVAVFFAGAFLTTLPFAAVLLTVRGCAGERAGEASVVAVPSAEDAFGARRTAAAPASLPVRGAKDAVPGRAVPVLPSQAISPDLAVSAERCALPGASPARRRRSRPPRLLRK